MNLVASGRTRLKSVNESTSEATSGPIVKSRNPMIHGATKTNPQAASRRDGVIPRRSWRTSAFGIGTARESLAISIEPPRPVLLVGPLGPRARGGRDCGASVWGLRVRRVEDALERLLKLCQLGIHVKTGRRPVVVAEGLHGAPDLRVVGDERLMVGDVR